LRQQLPVLRAFARVVWQSAGAEALTQLGVFAGSARTPGPILHQTIRPPARALVDAYLAHVGADPAAYRGVLPGHMFAQWCFPLQVQALLGAGYPLARTLNAGCTLEQRAPLPDNAPLAISAQLLAIDDSPTRVLLTERVCCGSERQPEALVAEWQGIIPRRRKRRAEEPRERRAHDEIPQDARALRRYALGPDVGLEFACLTGDINPVHWLGPWARVMGFRRHIVHGFATMARAIEALLSGRGRQPLDLARFSCRFTHPIVVPATVGVLVSAPPEAGAGDLWVGTEPGSKANLIGHYDWRETAPANRTEEQAPR
jgi:acyl dehydratase